MKKIINILLKVLLNIWLSNPVQGGVAAIITGALILGLIILIGWIGSLF
jgi:hypothetical protein